MPALDSRPRLGAESHLTRMLLARLYGFHRPFEALLRESAITERIGIDVAERARSPALAADLDVLGVDRTVTERLPMWSPGRPLPGALG